MRRPLDATNLNASDIEPAFALIHALHPGLAVDDWRRFASPLVDQAPSARSGLVGVRNEAGYLCGLFVYRVEADLAHEHAFIVDVIAALDVVDVMFVIRAMMSMIEATARRLDCGITRIRVKRNQVGLGLHLREWGLQVESEVLSMPASAASTNRFRPSPGG